MTLITLCIIGGVLIFIGIVSMVFAEEGRNEKVKELYESGQYEKAYKLMDRKERRYEDERAKKNMQRMSDKDKGNHQRV